MSLTLAFDTATQDTAAAICDGGEAVAERALGPAPGGRPSHGPALLRMVCELVDESGGWERVGTIAVGVGPGSFTGIRIGVATARALAQARGLPVAAIPSTAALAAGIGSDRGPGRTRLGVVDARRGEVFAAALRSGAPVAEPPEVLAPEDVGRLFQTSERPLAAGDGAVRFRDEFEAAGAEVPDDGEPVHRISARFLAALVPVFGTVGYEEVKPLYLRRPDAERWHERNRRDR